MPHLPTYGCCDKTPLKDNIYGIKLSVETFAIQSIVVYYYCGFPLHCGSDVLQCIRPQKVSRRLNTVSRILTQHMM